MLPDQDTNTHKSKHHISSSPPPKSPLLEEQDEDIPSKKGFSRTLEINEFRVGLLKTRVLRSPQNPFSCHIHSPSSASSTRLLGHPPFLLSNKSKFALKNGNKFPEVPLEINEFRVGAVEDKGSPVPSTSLLVSHSFSIIGLIHTSPRPPSFSYFPTSPRDEENDLLFFTC
ncbi:hypothetical protein JTE90_001205 [Oedothorax gibbosus]|uniref:Uncharacterized protein n=1 Tax=Oedothorax gibbosus TaxID=931172 RepID=A0AAV6UX03_9ARAC|nr:hypothetical protein JTE90_001205 [Oedothorax gibbosus]